MVGGAEWRVGAEVGAPSAAGGGVHLGDFERLVGEQRRHDRGEAPREHGLADSRRPDEQGVMRVGGGDRQRVARRLEAAHVDEVERFVGVGRIAPRRRRFRRVGPGCFAFQAGMELAEISRDAYLGAGHEGGFARVGGGHDHVGHAGPGEGIDDAERADDGTDAPVETELAEHCDVVERAGGERVGGGEQPERDRELEAGAGLADRGRREVHGDAGLRVGQARREQRGADALPALPAGGVGQADDRVAGQAARDAHLHAYEPAVDSLQHRAAYRREHRAPPRTRSTQGSSRSLTATATAARTVTGG